MPEHKNVLGTPLEICSVEPMTGFTREGSCKVTNDDIGVHGVCAAPRVNLLATHEVALLFVSLEELLAHSLDNGLA